jgi:MFS family permease
LPLDGTAQRLAARPARWRDASIWYCYLLLSLFTFVLTIQGNVLPFLKSRLGLSYGVASLHSSAIAAGMIVVGLVGDRVIRRIGRNTGLLLGTAAVVVGCILVALAPTVWFSLGGCLLMGVLGAFIPTIVFAVLAGVPAKYRDISYSESNALSYVFAIVAPLSVSFSLWLSIPWWSSLLLAAAVGLAITFACRQTHPADPAARILGLLGLHCDVRRNRVLRPFVGADIPDGLDGACPRYRSSGVRLLLTRCARR